MSTEKPKISDSIIGGIEKLSTLEATPLSTRNMVLSTIPIDGTHVVIRQGPTQLTATPTIQSQSQQSQHQQQSALVSPSSSNAYNTTPHRNNNTPTIIATSSSTKNTYNTTVGGSLTSNNGTISTGMTAQSKYVLLQQNGMGQYTTNEVVLVSTEPMDIGTTEQVISVNETGTATVCDEELTSLSWLQDKNLINNIVCTKNSRKAVEQCIRGHISPANEYVEDSSGVSEENTPTAEHTLNEYPSQQHHIHFNNNNHMLTKNRNNHQMLSPTHGGGGFISQSPQHVMHDQVNGNMTPLAATTTTVHVGPSGTTTVVEYKTNSSFIPSRLNGSNGIANGCGNGTTITPTANNYVPSSPQKNVVLTSLTSPQHQQQQSNQQYNSSINNNPANSLSATHHPHKKYLREKMNGFDQSGGGGTNNSSGGNICKTPSSLSPFSSGSSTNSNASSPTSSVGNYAITTIGHTTQGISTSSPEPPREYLSQNLHLPNVMKSPASYSTNSFENDSMKDFELTTVPVVNGHTPSSSIIAQQQQTQQHLPPLQQTQPLPIQKTSSSPPKQKHPTNVPYDPLVHTHNKPPYSFSSLIFMAIEGSAEKALPVKEIYAWIVQHFPYFKSAPTGWKNSVRHNLSLNKSFVKVEKAPNMGKGSLWRVEQQQRPNLIQALSRSPFSSAVDKISIKCPTTGNSTPTNSSNNSPVSTESEGSPGRTNIDARLFPNLSKAIKRMETSDQDEDSATDYNSVKYNQGYYPNGTSTPISNFENIERLARDCGADSLDDVNAATAMLALKHGPKVFAETFQNGSPVITSSPSEDHTYSAGGSGGSGSSSGGSVSSVCSSNSASTNMNNNVICIESAIANCGGDKLVSNGGFSVDNQSTCASSDAAYESSEDSHNISPEELEDQKRHRDGVYALLSLSSHIDISPIKRPSSTTVEEEHISSYMENIPHINGKGLLSNGCNTLSISSTINGSSGPIDEGYNTQSYYSHMASPSPPKKQKPLRNLRAKIKRKTALIR